MFKEEIQIYKVFHINVHEIWYVAFAKWVIVDYTEEFQGLI